jgi:putative membrane protein
VAALITAAVAAIFAGLPHATGQAPTWALLYGGAFAVAVMLLPGISGSLFLLMLGQYTTIAGAVHDRELVPLLVFGCGIAIGAALFIPFLRHLLRRHHDVTMAALTGLMAGSLRALWPWKVNYDPKVGSMDNTGVGDGVVWVLLFVVLGVAAAWGLARLERMLNPEDPAAEKA